MFAGVKSEVRMRVPLGGSHEGDLYTKGDGDQVDKVDFEEHVSEGMLSVPRAEISDTLT